MFKSTTSKHAILLLVLLSVANTTHAQDKKKSAAPPAAAQPAASEPERVDVDKIKEKYWAKGDESEMGVVQNRLYTKANKFEFSIFSGLIFSDPFLNVTPLGLSFGYNFSETVAAHFLYMRTFAKGSTALDLFEEFSDGTANTNLPISYVGGETTFSLIYGKLSLLGASILYYDMSLNAGFGVMNTETGNYLTPHLGLGQRFFLNKNISLKLDYRMMFYREEIREKVVPALIGTSKGFRNNFSNTITFGIDFLFGGGSDPK